MSRKVYMTVRSLTMVPVIATQHVIVTIDDDVSHEAVAKAIVEKGNHPLATVEDVGIDVLNVENADETTEQEFDENVIDYITSTDATTTFLDAVVTDSK